MIRQVYILAIIILFSSLTGCNKFLEEQSQNEMRPSTIQDLIGLMAGSAYPYQTTFTPFLELLTDNVQCNGGQGQKDYEGVVLKGKGPFTWSKDMYQELLNAEGLFFKKSINSWQILYERISATNTIIKYVDKVTGQTAVKENVKGQALALRAYYYLLLVNMYGAPYNAPGKDPSVSLGVPLRLDMEVSDHLYSRNTVKEVYDQIEKDAKEGAALLISNPQNTDIFKMNATAAYAILSRMYLYQENWEKAIASSNTALAINPNITQLSTFKGPPMAGYYLYNNGTLTTFANRIYDPELSNEIIWTYRPDGLGTGSTYDDFYKYTLYPGYSTTYNPPYAPSAELLNLYDNRPIADTAIYLGDLRSRTYLLTTAYLGAGFKVDFKYYGGNGTGGEGLRTAELYLNRAEAKINLAITSGNTSLLQEALVDINLLRSSRYDKRKSYIPITINNPSELLTFCREERRREFPFEGGHRWFDLRRYGMPSIKHYYELKPGSSQEVTLAQGDNRYTLQIPNVVLERNANLVQNP